MHNFGHRHFSLSVIVAFLLIAALAQAKESTLYIGTYTRGTESRGIYVYHFDGATGALRPASVAEGAENPSFLAIHPNGNILYSAGEIDSFDGKREGAVSAWSINDGDGQLTLINREGAGGTSPCHLTVDSSGEHLLAVGYGSGSVAVLPIDSDGRLQPLTTRIEHQGSSLNPERQTSPHPHQIVLDSNNLFALVPDLGLDQIVQYRFDGRTGKLALNDPPFIRAAAGAGPRHVAFHPDGARVYAINELDLTIASFDFNKDRGTLAPRETLTAIAADTDRKGVSGAEIAVHPNGRYLYVSLRGTDEIVAYRIGEPSAPLEFLERVPTGGKTPRNFAIDPSGKWLLAANQNSAIVTVFQIEDSGKLTPTSQAASVPSPVCLQFLTK